MNQTMTRIADATRRARQGGKGACMGNYSVMAISGRVTVAYRGTDVAHFANGKVAIKHGGWPTPTTKNVINAALWDTPYGVYQRDSVWYVATPTGDVEFGSGLTFTLDA